MVDASKNPSELFDELYSHDALLDVPEETLQDMTAQSQTFKLKKDLITFLENALNHKTQTLRILVRAYSQMCLKCNRVGDFGLYSDETERVAQLFAKRYVRKRFNYTEKRADKPQRPSQRRDTHQRALCAACQEGVCVLVNRAKK